MNVLIRVDSSLQIGSGHVARCLALAGGLRAQGAEVVFASRPLPGHMLEKVSEAGFCLYLLPTPSTDALAEDDNFWFGGVGWQLDAIQTADCAQHIVGHIDWLLVDHYGIDHRWEQLLRPCTHRIAVIDDLANRFHDCDLLIDSNLQAADLDRYQSLLPVGCVRLLGPRYVPLREEFAQQRTSLRVRDGELRRLLVFFGGMDASDQTSMALQAIADMESPAIETDVVVGGTNPRRESIQQFCLLHPAFHYHCQTNDMAQLMASADLAIGAGGTTTWERCTLGLPSVVVTVADNQIPATLEMARQGRVFYLGQHGTVQQKTLTHLLESLRTMPHWLTLQTARGMELVDGLGLQRVLHSFSLPLLGLRAATLEDCQRVYDWRNDPQTRSVSHNAQPIPYGTHAQWFSQALDNPSRILLIGLAEGQAVGVLRYDLGERKAIVSINLAPERRGQGLGAPLLRQGSLWMQEHQPGVREIHAEILAGNDASQAIFVDAGYKPSFSTWIQQL
jgi:UDP-2,4-diacetamido-2,4,6-trideoxy-beta-L-altropyranose hydrolase